VTGDRAKRLVQRYYDRAGYIAAVQATHAAFGNLVVTVEDQFAEGDRVATRWSATA
jgi:predicted ester cyclase